MKYDFSVLIAQRREERDCPTGWKVWNLTFFQPRKIGFLSDNGKEVRLTVVNRSAKLAKAWLCNDRYLPGPLTAKLLQAEEFRRLLSVDNDVKDTAVSIRFFGKAITSNRYSRLLTPSERRQAAWILRCDGKAKSIRERDLNPNGAL